MSYLMADPEQRLQQAEICLTKCRAGVYFSGIPVGLWGGVYQEELFSFPDPITDQPVIDIGYLGCLNRMVYSQNRDVTWDRLGTSIVETTDFDRRAVALAPTRRMQRNLVYVCRALGALRYALGVNRWCGQRGLNQLKRLVPDFVPYDLVETNAEEVKELEVMLRCHGLGKVLARFRRTLPQLMTCARELCVRKNDWDHLDLTDEEREELVFLHDNFPEQMSEE